MRLSSSINIIRFNQFNSKLMEKKRFIIKFKPTNYILIFLLGIMNEIIHCN
jgi:hypothetical protein